MLSSAIVIPVLFILAVVALLLSYYIRLSRRLRSQPLRQPDAAAPVQSSHSRRRQVSPAPSSSGLLLPRFKFSDLKRPGSVTVGGDCAICLAEFEPDHVLRLLPLCLHAFHEDCIDTWLAGEWLICPVCRAEVFRSDSDLLQTASSGGSFRLAIGSVSRGLRQDTAANSSSQTHSIRGGELEYVVDEEWELQLRDAVLPVHDEGEDNEIVPVVIDSQPPPSTAPTLEYQSSCGMIFTGSSRRWTELSEGLEMIHRWLS